LHSLKTAETGFKRVCGQELFPYVTEHPAAAEVFDEAMTGYTTQVSVDVADAHDFSGIGTLVDVGGGHGVLMKTILDAYPGLIGVLFDLPHVANDAQKRFDRAGLRSRGRTVGGAIFLTTRSRGAMLSY